jgi:hypothetical protein
MPRRPRLLVVASLCAAAAGLARAAEPPPLNSWNQLEDSGASGVARGVILLSTDLAFRMPRAPGTAPRSLFMGIQLHGSAMLTDHFGLRGDVTLHFHDDAKQDIRLIPMTLGGTVHPLPKSPFDLYFGARGGLAIVRIDDGDNELEPVIGVLGGVAFHYWGMFFVRAEVGYDLVRYASGARVQNLDAPYFAVGTGLSF